MQAMCDDFAIFNQYHRTMQNSYNKPLIRNLINHTGPWPGTRHAHAQTLRHSVSLQ